MAQRKSGTEAPTWLGDAPGAGEVFGGVKLRSRAPADGLDGLPAASPEGGPAAGAAEGGSRAAPGRPGLRVAPEHRPGWARACDVAPAAGETLYCTAGEGTLVALHGKTGDGSRLLEIRLAAGKGASFFAAASNVLVEPRLQA